MAHVTIKQNGEFYRMTPDKGYLLKSVTTGMTYTDVNTKDVDEFIVMEEPNSKPA